nr:MAG TPA: hypothetical protein [Caudoviricetes sp.]
MLGIFSHLGKGFRSSFLIDFLSKMIYNYIVI